MKYNLSNIARRANSYTYQYGKSAAWKLAWAYEKLAVINAEIACENARLENAYCSEEFEEVNRMGRERRELVRAIDAIKPPHRYVSVAAVNEIVRFNKAAFAA